MLPRLYALVFTFLLLGSLLHADPVIRKMKVDGFDRSAIIYPGKQAKKTPSPVIIAFHGFTDYADHFSRLTRLHEAWPEATVIYPQGLKKMSKRFKKLVPAWQATPGSDNDRDVHFVDALLADVIKTYRVDEHRIYAAGSSNGALFCYVLLVMRPERFAAFGPVAGACEFVVQATVPRPVIMIHGAKDTTVDPEAAKKTRDILRKLNQCGDEEAEWDRGYISYLPCATGQPLVWRLHTGGHIWPDDASKHIVRFFKEQARAEDEE